MKYVEDLRALALALAIAATPLAACSSSGGNDSAAAAAGDAGDDDAAEPLPVAPSRIGFGSCSNPYSPLWALPVAVEQDPELFIFLGDNIYGDTEDMDTMQDKYDKLAENEDFMALKETADLIATWDDHDYGVNDGGKNYPMKEESKQVFLEFWEEPEDSDRRQHAGIYTSYLYENNGRILQIILLDTRTFRDDLTPIDDSGDWKNDYMPNDDPSITMLGAEQWTWLEEQFLVEAELRIIGSSNQFSHEYNGYESWTNFPAEQQKMIDLIASTGANGVFFLSGDVHWGELSLLTVPGGYDLYDATSSGINQNWSWTEPNANRLGEVVPEWNTGLIDIDWQADPVAVTLKIIDWEGNERVTESFTAADISFGE